MHNDHFLTLYEVTYGGILLQIWVSLAFYDVIKLDFWGGGGGGAQCPPHISMPYQQTVLLHLNS